MTKCGDHIHLILPDTVERTACFRAVAADTTRVVRSFASADAWIESGAETDGGDAVLLFHWHQPGSTSGAALLERVAHVSGLVAFVAAERLSIADARAVLRGGAHDLLPAPLDPRLVRRTIDRALGDGQALRHRLAAQRDAEQRIAMLTPRERDILDSIAAGMGNKAIARRLELSPRTVEVHRANIMRRAGAANVAELLRIAFVAEAMAGTISIQNGA